MCSKLTKVTFSFLFLALGIMGYGNVMAALALSKAVEAKAVTLEAAKVKIDHRFILTNGDLHRTVPVKAR